MTKKEFCNWCVWASAPPIWCFVQCVQLGDLQAALETAVFTDNFSHAIKDNPQLWGNLPHPRSEQKDPSASKCPPVEFGQQESKQRQKKKRERRWRRTPSTLLPLTPQPPSVPVAHPTVASVWVQTAFPSSSIDPFQHRAADASHAACHAGPAALPSQLSKKTMNMKKLFTGVCQGGNFHHTHVCFPCWENNNSLMFVLRQTQQICHRQQRRGVLNKQGGWLCFTLV